MTPDPALVARARADPEAFREECARALEDAGYDASIRVVRASDVPGALRSSFRAVCDYGVDNLVDDSDRNALAHVVALAAALGVGLEDGDG